MHPSQLCRRHSLVHVANLVRLKLTHWKAAGTASPCFVTHLMDDLGNAKDAEEQVAIIRGCAGLAYAGKTGYQCQTSDVLIGILAGAESVRRSFQAQINYTDFL